MESCDVLIVGAGPAGSSCAWALRHSGLDVLVIDKQSFPRDKVCGGWITPRVLTDLAIDPAEYSQSRVLQPITKFLVGCIGSSPLEIDYERPVSYGIRRCEFDNYLLQRCGARFLPSVQVTHLQHAENGWIVNHQIHAHIVIGAGGHFCPVARFAGAKPAQECAVVAQEVEFEMDNHQLAICQIDGKAPELYFCSDMKGYGWCFRKGKFLNVGLGRCDSHGLPEHVHSFLQFLKAAGRIPFELPPLRGHAYLLQGNSERLTASNGMLLVGDSAGLAYSQSGEGIAPAVESGLLAAKTIMASKGVYNRYEFEKYHRLIKGNRSSLITKVGQHIPPTWISFLTSRLFAANWFVRDVVLQQWFLHSNSLISR